MDLPGLRHRKAQLTDLSRMVKSKITGKRESQPLVGTIYPTSPPVR